MTLIFRKYGCPLNLCNHFMMYVSWIILLYPLNLHSIVCQLYLHKTERKKKEISKN